VVRVRAWWGWVQRGDRGSGRRRRSKISLTGCAMVPLQAESRDSLLTLSKGTKRGFKKTPEGTDVSLELRPRAREKGWLHPFRPLPEVR